MLENVEQGGVLMTLKREFPSLISEKSCRAVHDFGDLYLTFGGVEFFRLAPFVEVKITILWALSRIRLLRDIETRISKAIEGTCISSNTVIGFYTNENVPGIQESLDPHF